MNKEYTLESLSQEIQTKKAQGHTIVLANGCFDLIHIGHIRYLKQAKAHGDLLVVAINNDASVRKLKGKGRPILKEGERAAILSSFSCVDYITIFAEDDVNKVLLALKPHIHAKGSDYTEDTVPEKDTVKSYGGKVIIAGGPKIRSTSEIIADIAKNNQP